MTMKKKILTTLSVVLVLGMAALGILAYLTSTADDANVMTLGNVSIEQHEYQRAEGVAHDAGDMGAGNGVKEGALVPFEQGQALYPAVPKNNVSTDYSAEQNVEDCFFWGDYVYSGTAGNGLWDDSKLSNVMDKMVFVENTGKSDAYIRTVIAFECPEGITIGEPSQGAEIMINTNIGTYDWEDVGYITVDGVRYAVLAATYQNALKPGNQSHPSLLQVVMTHNATNEDMALLGDTYDILVLSQAVQVEGFDTAAAALDAAFPYGDDKAITIAGWFGATKKPAVVNDNAALKDALSKGEKEIILISGEYSLPTLSGKDGVTIIGDENTVIGGDAVSTGFGGNFGKNTTIKNVNFEGTTNGVRYSYGQGGNTVFENCTFAGDAMYGFHIDESKGATFTFNNCTFVGFNAFASDLVKVTFNNCTFLSNGNYGHTNIWSVGEFNNCTFGEGATYGTRGNGKIYINGILQ